MRRPTPLPSSGTARDDEAAGEATREPASTLPAAEPLETPDPAAEDQADTQPIPVWPRPFWGRAAPPTPSAVAGDSADPLQTDADPSPSAPAAASPGEPGDAGPADPVGMRDLWRAARARRRALSSEVRRFTARARRRRAVWLGSIAAIVLVALGSVAAAYSPLFAVERVVIAGAEQLDAEEVAAALSAQLGIPLPLVDESAVKAALVTFPLVESYAVEARPPHELVVRIVERTPIGVIASPAGYTLVDAAGVALSTTQAPAAGRPVLQVTGGTGSEAFTAVGQVLRSLPESIMVQVTEASATTPNDVTVTLGATGTRIVWGSSEDSAKKALALSAAMQSRPAETVSVYDVSSPLAVVIQ